MSVKGWRAISYYTGASIHTLRYAAIAGELNVHSMEMPHVSRNKLDAWLRSRDPLAELTLNGVKLPADLLEAAKHIGFDRWA